MAENGNPFLTDSFLPPFHRMEADHVAPAVDALLEEGRERIRAVSQDEAPPEWENVMAPLDQAAQRVEEGTGPIRHLVSVAETPELRQAYQEVLPKISAFWAEIPKDQALWSRVRSYAETDEAGGLDPVHRRHLDKTLRSFRRSGADLPSEERDRLKEIELELSDLQRRFAENVLDATAAYELHVPDESRVRGLPPDAARRARAAAEEKEREGFILTLDPPTVDAVLKHVEDRSIRKEIHQAYVGRCREGEFDNRDTIVRILELRREMASLLGYADFSDYQVEEWMAGRGERAEEFVRDMVERTRPYWERDVRILEEKAGEWGLGELRPWDVAFLTERIRSEQYSVDEEELRPYFPLNRVLEGLFELARRLFGLDIRPEEVEEKWHPTVRHYRVLDQEGVWLGSFYTDWFPRKEKRQGAWMNPFRTGGPGDDGSFAPHLGLIAGNFSPPEEGRDALLTHREVQTLFHEFGHLLHHVTGRVPLPARSGLNVAWDWVEVPSQLMENWTWEREALRLVSGHVETGEPLPDSLFERLAATRHFMGGWRQMRQLGFGTLDLALHREYDPSRDGDVLAFVEERLRPLSPDSVFAENHILTSFTHLFSGGYASGYFSYLWSEVLEADIFTRFKEEGILAREPGERLLHTILAQGDAVEPDELFREFMGRDPDPEALVARNLGDPEEPTATTA